jgi:hypothetical protein
MDADVPEVDKDSATETHDGTNVNMLEPSESEVDADYLRQKLQRYKVVPACERGDHGAVYEVFYRDDHSTMVMCSECFYVCADNHTEMADHIYKCENCTMRVYEFVYEFVCVCVCVCVCSLSSFVVPMICLRID